MLDHLTIYLLSPIDIVALCWIKYIAITYPHLQFLSLLLIPLMLWRLSQICRCIIQLWILNSHLSLCVWLLSMVNVRVIKSVPRKAQHLAFQLNKWEAKQGYSPIETRAGFEGDVVAAYAKTKRKVYIAWGFGVVYKVTNNTSPFEDPPRVALHPEPSLLYKWLTQIGEPDYLIKRLP